ncbi:MAG TPA: glycosyltransferase [Candidatus Hydrogenedentes bacterium]|nr:glycosyltransferase [Candidatus Hydrogenedentota bacterium]HPG67606.1 glycosyltransferase [Candidatus Hydrogenedentota bacterium]
MGKALFLSTPVPGHVNPTLALVGELVQRGEQVVYVSTQDFRPSVEHVGAEFRAYPPMPMPDLSTMENLVDVAEFALSVTRDFMPDILERVAAEKPDYILHDALAMGGKIAAARLGVPAVSTCPVFAVRPGRSTGLFRYDLEILRMVSTALPAMIRAFRIGGQIQRLYGHTGGPLDAFLNLEPVNLVFTSRAFQPHGNRFGPQYLFVGPQLAMRPQFGDVPLDRLDDRPLVYVSMGTIYNRNLDFYRQCLEAFADGRFQVILSIGNNDIGALGPIPPNAIVRNTVPQLQVLERADAFITHGGMNSASESLYHGVPLVLIPQGGDQLMVALRVHQLGAGIHLNRNKVTPERLRALTERVIADPSFRERGRFIGDSFRATGSHIAAADAVLAYVRNGVIPASR